MQTDANINRVLERVSYSMSEAAAALGIGETYFAELVAAGKVKTFRLGRRRLVRKADLQAFVDRLVEQDAGGL